MAGEPEHLGAEVTGLAGTKTRVVVAASPSLALTKYWGKQDVARNLPATPSVAVTLAGLTSTTTVSAADGPEDEVVVDGRVQPPARYAAFFQELRRQLPHVPPVAADSSNDYPAAAGLASSAAGFAALAWGCCLLAGRADRALASRVALAGSASAARSVFSGFVELPAGADHARPVHPVDHWPQLRVLVVVTRGEAKTVSSRAAMERVRTTSPLYGGWLTSAPQLHRQALQAVADRDLAQLGPVMSRSYHQMFATMLAADPPIRYWSPATVRVLDRLAQLRAAGLTAWETMDAGPQVKVLCLAPELETIRAALVELDPSLQAGMVVCSPGSGAWQVDR